MSDIDSFLDSLSSKKKAKVAIRIPAQIRLFPRRGKFTGTYYRGIHTPFGPSFDKAFMVKDRFGISACVTRELWNEMILGKAVGKPFVVHFCYHCSYPMVMCDPFPDGCSCFCAHCLIEIVSKYGFEGVMMPDPINKKATWIPNDGIQGMFPLEA